jgi:hypothetical protein
MHSHSSTCCVWQRLWATTSLSGELYSFACEQPIAVVSSFDGWCQSYDVLQSFWIRHKQALRGPYPAIRLRHHGLTLDLTSDFRSAAGLTSFAASRAGSSCSRLHLACQQMQCCSAHLLRGVSRWAVCLGRYASVVQEHDNGCLLGHDTQHTAFKYMTTGPGANCWASRMQHGECHTSAFAWDTAHAGCV